MSLSVDILIHLADLAIDAATKAGQLIASYANRDLLVKNKTIEQSNDGLSYASQVVTEVDLLSQDIILELLMPTCKTYNLALLTEESVDNNSRLLKDYFWCIDPLDGTLPFIESTSGYSVYIALVSKSGEPVIGVIFNPLSKTLYHAVKNVGVFKNREHWKLPVERLTTNRPFVFICDRSFVYHVLFDLVISKLTNFAMKIGCSGVEIIKHGGGAMNAIWVIENAPACYFKFPKPKTGGGSIWDYAASAAIFSETTASASDIFGNSLDLNRSDSSFMNHRGVIYASDWQIRDFLIDLYSSLNRME